MCREHSSADLNFQAYWVWMTHLTRNDLVECHKDGGCDRPAHHKLARPAVGPPEDDGEAELGQEARKWAAQKCLSSRWEDRKGG